MNRTTAANVLGWAILAASGALGAAVLWRWIVVPPPADVVRSVPGMDDPYHAFRRAQALASVVYKMGRSFARLDGKPADLPGSWPRFRGERFDNISTETVALADAWPAGGPEALWGVDLGEGHAGAAVFQGRVYVMDYDEKLKADMLRCFSLGDGREIWRRWYDLNVKRNHGMSRTVPAVTEKHIVTIGPKCHVMCVVTDTGDFLWGLDLQAQYGTKEPGWYTGQCPLIDDGVAVLAPAGTNVLLMGVACDTGKTVWETPNPRKWNMSHASIVPMTFQGRRMYVYAAVDGMVGVAADGAARGQVLWETTAWGYSTVSPSPVVFEDGRLFCTTGYGAGSAMLQVYEENGRLAVKSLYRLKPREGLTCEQQTPILYQGRLFGVITSDSDAGPLRQQFACFDPAGKIVWASGNARRFGSRGAGPYLLADGKFFVLDDEGVLTILKASTDEFVELAKAKVLPGHDSWAPIALAGGRLLLRDSKRMVCLDVRAKP